jgi:acetyltransferase-like isoleucine patch superfamily enzyme
LHRAVDPIGHARKSGVKIGEECRLLGVKFGTEPYLVSLGDHVSATDTEFVTHDGGVWVFRGEHPDIDVVRPIKVGNNVFFGMGTLVLAGVTIGDNVVIGAGSVVTKDIPSDCVAAGVPARPIKTIDEYYQGVIKEALETKRMNAREKRQYLLKRFFSE